VCLGVRSGVASNADEAFVVSQEYAEENGLEKELLYPIIRGKFTRRWQAEWDGDVAIYPYDKDGEHLDVSDYPNIKEHLDEYEDTLRSRYCVETGGKSLYEYDGPRPRSVFEGDFKIAVPDMATENHFAYTDGYDCFKNTSYVLTFSKGQSYSEKELLGALNSSVAEFVVKQMSPFLNDRYYRYKAQYLEAIPLPEPGSEIEEIVDRILVLEDKQREVERFPKSYVGEYDSEFDTIAYEWQTRRYPVDAEIQETTDGEFTVQAGRSDTITDAAMYADDRDAQKRRAEYVHAAVDGRNVKQGETTTIPIPRREEGVEEFLSQLEADRKEVERTDIDALEAEIDSAVYDLFDLTEDERQVIEDYLEVF